MGEFATAPAGRRPKLWTTFSARRTTLPKLRKGFQSRRRSLPKRRKTFQHLRKTSPKRRKTFQQLRKAFQQLRKSFPSIFFGGEKGLNRSQTAFSGAEAGPNCAAAALTRKFCHIRDAKVKWRPRLSMVLAAMRQWDSDGEDWGASLGCLLGRSMEQDGRRRFRRVRTSE